jgi:hypothetical protein
MDNLTVLEECFKKYIKNMAYWAPEGIMQVDLNLLNQFDLLKFFDSAAQSEDSLTRYFHVVESPEKITLINEQFVIWIVPENVNGTPTTYALVAINHPTDLHLEIVFSVTGVYNTSWLVLRVLEKYLKDIQETEDLLNRYRKVS